MSARANTFWSEAEYSMTGTSASEFAGSGLMYSSPLRRSILGARVATAFELLDDGGAGSASCSKGDCLLALVVADDLKTNKNAKF
jgi:hypothetical protein